MPVLLSLIVIIIHISAERLLRDHVDKGQHPEHFCSVRSGGRSTVLGGVLSLGDRLLGGKGAGIHFRWHQLMLSVVGLARELLWEPSTW